MTGNIDDVRAPRSMKNIVEEVMDWLQRHAGTDKSLTSFELCDDGVKAVWPELHKSSPEAHLRVAVSIYYEIANRWGFEPTIPPIVKELVL